MMPSVPGSIAVVSRDFKMPKVWRSNIAADIKIPFQDLVFTGEFIYTKDLDAIVQYNINQKPFNSALVGPDTRPVYNPSSNTDKRYVSGVSTAMVLDNASKGYSYSLTAMITKPYSNGLSGSFAYTYSMAKDLSANPGSAASSAWGSNPALYGQNDPGLSYSRFSVPHRVVGNISYRVEYFKHFATTFSLIYEGSSMGRLSYIYANDFNNDGNNADLIYIPKDQSEITFADNKNSQGVLLFTAAEQSTAFWNFVNQDDYLKNHKGEYAKRYGAVMPWYNSFDFKLLQDVYTNIGKRRHTIQLSLDLLNVGNLINKNWGVRQTQSIGAFDFTLLKGTVGKDNKPTFQLNTITVDGKQTLPTSTYKDVRSTSSTWGAQIGIRYIF